MKNTNWRDVPIPALMQHLPLDKRGYPIIPLIVTDDSGRPNFAINNAVKHAQFLAEDRCGICGGKLYRARWLVGGPGSAFMPHGAYLDAPMHTECMHYALQVCPYLAAPNWGGGGVGKAQAKKFNTENPENPLLIIGTDRDEVFPDRPELFVAVQYTGRVDTERNDYGQTVLRPPRPYRKVEFWTEGQQLSQADGEAAVEPILASMIQKLHDERIAP